MLTEAEFRALAAAGYNRIPLVLDSFADLDTPLSLYLKLARGPYTFLLESVVGGERFGRFSFIGLPATTRIRATGRRVSVDDATGVIEAHEGDPLEFVADYLKRFRAAPLPGLPRFCGGLAGYFGYDTVRHIETRLAHTAKPPTPGLADVPDLLLLLTEELAVVDNLAGKISLIVYADPARPDAYATAVARLDALRRRLREPVAIPYQTTTALTEAASEFGADGFQAAVVRAKEYIAAGDIMQVVVSQRMRRPFAEPPLSLYRALRSVNPSPYMFYYDFGDFQVVGASPEILVRKEGDEITLRPIAGTRPRGVHARRRRSAGARVAGRPEGDRRARDAARPRPQRRRPRREDRQRARHRADDRRALFARDAHRVERRGHAAAGAHQPRRAARGVSGRNRAAARPRCARWRSSTSWNPRAAASMPGRSATSSFQDDMDTAIALRTAVVKDGVLYVQAGGGIVHDSTPEGEWQETLNKARALMRAADLVQAGLDADA